MIAHAVAGAAMAMGPASSPKETVEIIANRAEKEWRLRVVGVVVISRSRFFCNIFTGGQHWPIPLRWQAVSAICREIKKGLP
jgi:hypothetical protein